MDAIHAENQVLLSDAASRDLTTARRMTLLQTLSISVTEFARKAVANR